MLRHYVDHGPADRFFFDRLAKVRIADLARGTSLGGGLTDLSGRSVLIATASQLTSALALIELDGVARRLTILPPDVNPDHLRALIAGAEIDAVIVDGPAPQFSHLPLCVTCTPDIAPRVEPTPTSVRTEWVLLTSGTTGVPKMVVHSLAGLTAAIAATKRND